jgi:hypothetical protein
MILSLRMPGRAPLLKDIVLASAFAVQSALRAVETVRILVTIRP